MSLEDSNEYANKDRKWWVRGYSKPDPRHVKAPEIDQDPCHVGARGFNSYYAPNSSSSAIITTITATTINWQQFHQFLLQRMNKDSAEDRLRYAKRYAAVLTNNDASELLQLSPDRRIHTMKALSNLAKFTGRYDPISTNKAAL